MPQWNDGAGISSSIPDVVTSSWANLSRDHKLLICQAGQIGELQRGGFELENTRRELAIGMAAIEIYQTLIDRQYEVRFQGRVNRIIEFSRHQNFRRVHGQF